MKLRKKNMFFAVVAIAGLVITLSQISYAEEPVRVLVLPFTIHAEKDLSFLQRGIEKMLTSRISTGGNITVAGSGSADASQPITREHALSEASGQSVDYVVFGSLTVFGESISTDAELIDVQKKKTVISFSRLGDSKDDALDHVNIFAGQVNEKLSGGTVTPDKISEGKDVNSLAVQKTHYFWKSPSIKTRVTGMAVGDVDGDGKNETVLCGEKYIYIYRCAEDTFEKIAEVKRETYDRIIRVDTADINTNGKSEIFITNIRKKNNRLISYVLEWDGKNFKKIVEDSDWFFRVLNSRGKDMLLGQKQTMGIVGQTHTTAGVEPFKGDIRELEWNNGQYETVKSLKLPKGICVYCFAMGDVMDSGEEMLITFTKREYLQILKLNGEEEWTSDESYGGNLVYLEVPSLYDTKETANFYLPQRIIFADLDRDGKNEVIVVNNKDVTRGVFSRARSFSSGRIQSFYWDTIGLQENWQTQKISGYISDYTVADINNDGRDELVFSVVTKDGKILGRKKSHVIARYAVK